MINATDLSVIAMVWLTLADLGYVVADLDLSEPSYIQRTGSHNVYTFSVIMRDDETFPENEFSERLDRYSGISAVKPHCYSVEYYPARYCTCFSPELGTYATELLKNFSRVYISVFI